MTSNTERGIAHYCPYWRSDVVAEVARATDRRAAVIALDSAHPDSLDARINGFFNSSPRGHQTMPSNTAASLPPSRFDNNSAPAPIGRLPAGMVARELASRGDNGTYLRGYGHHNGNGADQMPSAEEVVEYVAAALRSMRDDETQESVLLEGLAHLLDQAFNTVPANDQSPRLPNGGVAPSELYAPEMSNAGSGSPRSAAWSGVGQPPPTDRAREGAGRGWGATDRPAWDHRRRPAYDHRAQPVGDFASRFPEAMKISCW